MSFRKITVKSGNEEFTMSVTEEEYRNYYRPWWQMRGRAASVSAAGRKQRRQGPAGRGSSAQRNAGGSGGKHIRRREARKQSAQRNVRTAARSFPSTTAGIRSIAAMTATSRQDSGGMCKVDKFYSRDGHDIQQPNSYGINWK